MQVKERNFYFDNVKVFLIFCVVLGHFIEPLIDVDRFSKTLVLFIYSFHMPAFIFISGYFFKGNMEKGWFLKIVKKFLVPYMVFQLSFVLFTKLIGVGDYRFTLLYPSYTCWFLFAIFIWNIALKIIVKINLKIEYAILLNIIFAIFASYVNKVGVIFAISRIIIFFPFFMCGYYFKINKIDIKTIINNKKVSILILISNVIILFLFYKSINIGWLYCNMPYSELGIKSLISPLIRLFVYFYQIIISLSIFNLISCKKYLMTDIGSNTLPIYIIHSFIVKLVLSTGFYDNVNFIKIVFLFFISIMIVCFIGNKFFIKFVPKNNEVIKS